MNDSIKNAVAYVDSLKTYTKAAQIIDDLIRAFLSTLKDLEGSEYGSMFFLHQIERLTAIIKLHEGDETLTFDEIEILNQIKENTQYYEGNSARKYLYKFQFIDKVLQKVDPDKKTRPTNIDQIDKGFEILVEHYGKNRQQPIFKG